METKVCTHKKCGKELPLTSFSSNRANKDGHENWCKDCKNQAQAAYRRRQGIQPLHRRPNTKTPGNGRKTRSARRSSKQTIGPVTRASAQEIIDALRKGVALEILDPLQKVIDEIKEKFQLQ